tara:strand:+ start:902 stop:1555 length:654 start_codon:yes stop_codon:yes gene_type:complete
MDNLPYVTAAGTLETMLDKIQTASVPEKFSQDFVSTKLAMKGGTARAIIPFIKKMGLVSPDGAPTERYAEFRNSAYTEHALAQCMREVYATLFEMNEYVYELDNNKLKGLILQATGAEPSSAAVQKTLSTFNALKKRANFNPVEHASTPASVAAAPEPAVDIEHSQIPLHSNNSSSQPQNNEGINLSYTINLNLPTTTEIEVFNSIFKSLKQHLLQE